MVEVAILGAVAAGLGVAEQARLQRARAKLGIRVHVNGTRGKSTVTRLLVAALQASGVRTLGKVTGTQARWLLPDGSEEPVRRRGGRATIREQAWALLRAADLGCDAVVLECMALRPELLWVSEHRMVRSTLGVITNVRDDHGDVMGRALSEIARTLANTIPVGGTLVIGDADAFPFFDKEAPRRGSRAVLAPPLGGGQAPDGLGSALAWHAPENLGVAMAAARLLGVTEPDAWRGFACSLPDPGTARWTLARRDASGEDGPGTLLLVDALAANDPDSFQRVLAGALDACPPAPGAEIRLIYHHRLDRAQRAMTFGLRLPGILAGLRTRGPVSLWTTGDPGGARVVKAGALQGPADPAELLARWGVEGSGSRPGALPPALVIVACGNTRGALGWQARYGPWRPVPLGGEGSTGESAPVGGGLLDG